MASMMVGDSTLESLTPSVNARLEDILNLWTWRSSWSLVRRVVCLSMKQGRLFCFVMLRSLKPWWFMPRSWYLQ
jgi:hypothetical protein